MRATTRLYLDDDECFEADAMAIAVDGCRVAFDRTCFYPGGGGQPPDTGSIAVQSGEVLDIVSAEADAHDVVWHTTPEVPPSQILGQTARLRVDRARRLALTRYHTVLHILNTIALREYGGWITGVQIGTEYSRIDFKLDALSTALVADLQQKVNAVIGVGHPLKAYYISEEAFAGREDLLRTLDAKPPVSQGRVRVVEIQGFDAQACGGTHVKTTSDVGTFSILRTENKGRNNKRLYVQLAA